MVKWNDNKHCHSIYINITGIHPSIRPPTQYSCLHLISIPLFKYTYNIRIWLQHYYKYYTNIIYFFANTIISAQSCNSSSLIQLHSIDKCDNHSNPASQTHIAPLLGLAYRPIIKFYGLLHFETMRRRKPTTLGHRPVSFGFAAARTTTTTTTTNMMTRFRGLL